MLKFKHIILGTTAIIITSMQLNAAASVIVQDDTTIGNVSGKGSLRLSAASTANLPKITTSAKNTFEGGLEVDGVSVVATNQSAFGKTSAIKFTGRSSTINTLTDATADLNMLARATLAPTTTFTITSISGSGDLSITSGTVVAPAKDAAKDASGNTTVGTGAIFDCSNASEKNISSGILTLMPGSTLKLPSGKISFLKDIVLG